MITKDQVQELIKEKLAEDNCFVVELEVRAGNNILLEIDSHKGITVEDCVNFSKTIEHNLDRENEDFELNVSSPGLDKPLRVKEQYVKNIGRNVTVVLTDGEMLKGELKEVGADNITIEFSQKEKVEGKKKKLTVLKQEIIKMNTIKETKILISFK
ncbi:MAG: ribosome assembly cofactor RimP [Flavobacteriales bacterium CG_4_10_14_0_2_um_filter_32_8]|nr:MAG: ribosome assembly cofactor RimP [Flavobacteriales bacterium CG_4_10_14_0_2_um_filter_32_8]PJB16358.1 MAG: ribosome assembly cofactor RimP [Flavobacteriales bacterium CG_4_9_14_3_um_filter_32_8]